MKYLSLSLALLGIFFLLSLLVLNPLSPQENYQKNKNFSLLANNQKITLTGKVTKERSFDKDRLITLDNKIEITCKKCKSLPSLKDKNISALVQIAKYKERTYFYVLEIHLLNE